MIRRWDDNRQQPDRNTDHNIAHVSCDSECWHAIQDRSIKLATWVTSPGQDRQRNEMSGGMMGKERKREERTIERKKKKVKESAEQVRKEVLVCFVVLYACVC